MMNEDDYTAGAQAYKNQTTKAETYATGATMVISFIVTYSLLSEGLSFREVCSVYFAGGIVVGMVWMTYDCMKLAVLRFFNRSKGDAKDDS